MITQLAIATIVGLAIFGITTTHADHVDGHIYIDMLDTLPDNHPYTSGDVLLEDYYTYSIVERFPSGYNIPPEYNKVIQDGIQDGLSSWTIIDEFTYTYSASNADILVRLETHNPQYEYLTEIGFGTYSCITNDEIQCTIIIYIDQNYDGQQSLLSYDSIKRTTAHEFGHNLGLPHHPDEDHLMYAYNDDDTYRYVVLGTKIPDLHIPHIPNSGKIYFNTADGYINNSPYHWTYVNQTYDLHNDKTYNCITYKINNAHTTPCSNTEDDKSPRTHHTTQEFLEYAKRYVKAQDGFSRQLTIIIDIGHYITTELFRAISR